ncbi:hypothetical protein Slala02_27970 [Streptomyces lavendulae subsp. lavendulae]|nr:hypothetical protein Slala01_31260 [Streptomyces lavendulae subsp. lavendulae]GLX26977.1 hypothetical protein Slala02_27970 [Streptomyces lavendulae subsp. lavendulae]
MPRVAAAGVRRPVHPAEVLGPGDDSVTVDIQHREDAPLPTDRSWAAVRWPEQHRPGTVYQHGPRRAWDAVEAAACGGTKSADRLDCLGLTITPSSAAPWLDDPGNPLPGATCR